MHLATSELIDRLAGIPREKLLELDAEGLARIDWLLSEARHDQIDTLCAAKVASFDAGPLLWATSLTRTRNPKSEIQGLDYEMPFPKKSYFVPLFQEFLNLEVRAKENTAKRTPKAEALFIPKSREMLTSWSIVAYAVWRAQWHRYDVLFQTSSLDKAAELIEYSATLWSNQEAWLKQRYPLAGKEPTVYELKYEAGGRIMAIPGGPDKVRLFHPTLLVLDEASYLPDAEQSYDAALPVCQEIVAVSTASADSWFARECSET